MTLHNPWAHNKTVGDYSTPPEDLGDGYMRISREDYEKYFDTTTIEKDEED
ncbi:MULTISPECIES: hypothetical protein [unclassified Actinomyces]|uniref:hypothetical protein n=1 Tax=unclassified Actinomyces TaxID=2609248 RepID=UPI00131F386D|nr:MULTISPECIES: hypothetical protein [unclassified Actinomyces]